MSDTHRWTPPLPSIGRAGPRIAVGNNPYEVLQDNLEDYYTERRSVPDIFECRVQRSHMERCGFDKGIPTYLSDFSPDEQCQILLKNLYFKGSANFVRKLKDTLHRKGGLNHARQWFHTANAAVLPLLITEETDPGYYWVDKLTKWALENCANNYAKFQSDWKSLKKAIRKAYAEDSKVQCPRAMRTYYAAFRRRSRSEFPSENSYGRYVLTWCQTRATGLADSIAMEQSVAKFEKTVTNPGREIPLNPQVLWDTITLAPLVDGASSRISVGTTSCLESTRKEGGKSGYLKLLGKTRALHRVYDPITLSYTEVTPRPVRDAHDVLSWAIQSVHEHPAYVRTVRLHVVAEPSKARTITVAPYSYQLIMGVMAHMFSGILKSRSVRSGMRADRHLWRFLRDTLNPQNTAWQDIDTTRTVYALSTDLSEATDHGNLSVARQIWQALIQAADKPGFPKGLALLAKSLFCGKRYIIIPHKGKFKYITRSRAWFMGDMMTKVIFTIGHDYCCRISLRLYTIVGDDFVGLENDRRILENHLKVLEAHDFQVSWSDTYISSKFAFYCEEGCMVPQRAMDALHVQQRREQELGYLDYPRIRLLLPVTCETDNFSMTNVGRFSLLGKESRWVHNTNPRCSPAFARATLLQHLLVPQDRDTHCPFTPLEMGGDGGFPPSVRTLMSAIHDHSRDPRETLYRMSSLVGNKFAHKLVRSDRLNEVVHKHHIMVPKIEGLERLLPADAVIRPNTDAARIMMRSIRFPGIESPSQTFLRLCRGVYYAAIFRGEDPPEPVFSIDREYTGGRTEDPQVDLAEFLDLWCKPGFRFANHEDYFVRRELVEPLDPLNLGWKFGYDSISYPTSRQIFSDWAQRNISFEEMCMDDVLAFITRSDPLPDRVVKRLNLFMESDSYILQTLPRGDDIPQWFGLATRDYRLCADIQRHFDYVKPGSTHFVVALDPNLYLSGRAYEVIGRSIGGPWSPCIPEDIDWVEDPGALLHVDYTEYVEGVHISTVRDSNGTVTAEPLWEANIDVSLHRYHYNVVVARLLL